MKIQQTIATLNAKGHANNFNLIRIMAAVCVIISHAYPIMFGRNVVEPLSWFLPSGSIGSIGVWTFFLISGFFISQSFERHTLPAFAWARVLRIYPGLIAVLFLSAFLIGPIFTELPLWAYFKNPMTYKYILKGLDLYQMTIEQGLPGEVFAYNPYSYSINNPLWTLFFEAACYLMVVMVGLIANRNKYLYSLFFALYFFIQLSAVWLDQKHPFLSTHKLTRSGLEFSFPFVLGMAYYRFKEVIPYNSIIAIICFTGIYAFRNCSYFETVFIVLGSYIILFLGFLPSKILRLYNKLGDYSYGVYIYGWPIQQILASKFRHMTPLANMLVAIPIAIIVGIISWHLIEKPSMQLKKNRLIISQFNS